MSNKSSNKFKHFLEMFTPVSKKFIDEYEAFYDMCDNDPFGIPLDAVMEFLEIKNKSKFYENLIKEYKEHVDYVKTDAHYVTLDTFEKICMVSKAPKANNVRSYHISIRKFIQYYHEHMAAMIVNNAIKHSYECVYIILTNKDSNMFQVGTTKQQLKSYAKGDAEHPDIKFIVLVKNKDTVDACVKNLIQQCQFRAKQDIYKVDIDVFKNSIMDCAILDSKYSKLLDDADDDADAYVVFDGVAPRMTRHKI